MVTVCAACGRRADEQNSTLVCLRPDPEAPDGLREERLHNRQACVDKYNEEEDAK